MCILLKIRIGKLRLSPFCKTVHFDSFPSSLKVTLDDLPKLIPVQKIIGDSEEMKDGVVEPVSTVAQQIQAKFQTHPGVTFIIGELNICNNLLENIKCFILVQICLSFNYVLEDLFQTSWSLRNFSVANLQIILLLSKDSGNNHTSVCLL